MEYLWINGVQKMTDLGWPLVSKFWILTGNYLTENIKTYGKTMKSI